MFSNVASFPNQLSTQRFNVFMSMSWTLWNMQNSCMCTSSTLAESSRSMMPEQATCNGTATQTAMPHRRARRQLYEHFWNDVATYEE